MIAFTPYLNDPTGIPDGWPMVLPRVISGVEELREGEVAMEDGEYAAHVSILEPMKDAWNEDHKDRGPGKTWTRTEFRELFTDGEWSAFRAAEKAGNPYAEAVWENLLLVTVIEQRNPKTVEALGALAAIGVIQPSRISEILA